jgi:hypothetical protein
VELLEKLVLKIISVLLRYDFFNMGLWRRLPRVPSENNFDNVVASSGSMIVVSNRLPFVLQRDTDGKLVRKAR